MLSHSEIGTAKPFFLFEIRFCGKYFPKISFNHPWIGKGNFISDLEGCSWGYGWALETRNNDYLRPKGAAFWAGLYNSYFTIDPLKQVIVLYFSQFFPFNDKYAYSMYRNFENEVYKL